MNPRYCASCNKLLTDIEITGSLRWCEECLEDGEVVDLVEGEG